MKKYSQKRHFYNEMSFNIFQPIHNEFMTICDNSQWTEPF
jgi:hypothetical protein